MAVPPAPATTSTVTIGPSWVTAPIAAPAPETSAAPISASRRLSVKMSSTVSGMDTAMVGSSETRIRNQPTQMNSRHSNGFLSALPVSKHIRKNPPATSAPGRILLPNLVAIAFDVVMGAAPGATKRGPLRQRHVSPVSPSLSAAPRKTFHQNVIHGAL